MRRASLIALAFLAACATSQQQDTSKRVPGHYAIYFEPSFASPVSLGTMSVSGGEIEEAIRTVFTERFDSVMFFEEPPKTPHDFDAVVKLRIDRSPGAGGWPPPLPGSTAREVPLPGGNAIIGFDVVVAGKKPLSGFVTVQSPAATGYNYSPQMLLGTAADVATDVTRELRRATPAAIPE